MRKRQHPGCTNRPPCVAGNDIFPRLPLRRFPERHCTLTGRCPPCVVPPTVAARQGFRRRQGQTSLEWTLETVRVNLGPTQPSD